MTGNPLPRQWSRQRDVGHGLPRAPAGPRLPVAVADALAADGWAGSDKIVSRGLSAGGLLQGAVFSMAPQRWRAVVAEVPFVDCVTTMLDPGIPLTVAEWGDPRDPSAHAYLASYSPYDNVPSWARALTWARPDVTISYGTRLRSSPSSWMKAQRPDDRRAAHS
jgi:oligopeptidase B